ncbi:hypothetical protein N8654_04365 [Synechococcus sp. AH-601-B19]|nr:hypothetical protein [Synechococcus sp. AH-601-B19]
MNGTKGEWVARPTEDKMIGFKADPKFVERLDEVTKSSHVTKSAFMKMAISRLMNEMAAAK